MPIKSLPVTIRVTDENDDVGSVIGDTRIPLSENNNTEGTNYKAVDPEGTRIDWHLTGPDAGAFEISDRNGRLSFKSPPNFEIPGDTSGSDPTGN